MRARHLAPLALSAVLAACSGGGGSGAPVAPITGPVIPGTATFPLSVTIPSAVRVASGAARAPRYVSPGTASLVVYEGTTVLFVGNFNAAANPQFTTVFAKTGTTSVTGGSCVPGASSSSVCTITITTTIGAHTYDVVTYPQSQGAQASSVARTVSDVGTLPGSYRGVILSEGELAVTLSPGTNPGQTITLLGVASQATFVGPVLTQHLNGNGPLVGIIGTQYTFQYSINDSSRNQIIQPGNYDNGPGDDRGNRRRRNRDDDGGFANHTARRDRQPVVHRHVRGQRDGDVHRCGAEQTERDLRLRAHVHVGQLLQRNARDDHAAMRAELGDPSDHRPVEARR